MWEEYGLSKLRYNGLKKAIPKEWKDFFRQNEASLYLPVPLTKYDLCVLSGDKGFSSKVYRYIMEDVTQIHYKYVKWREDLGEDIAESIWDFGKIFQQIYSVTNVPRLRSFQYRMLQRGLVTNIQLYNWKLIETELCTFCLQESETVIHLFCDCTSGLNTDLN